MTRALADAPKGYFTAPVSRFSSVNEVSRHAPTIGWSTWVGSLIYSSPSEAGTAGALARVVGSSRRLAQLAGGDNVLTGLDGRGRPCLGESLPVANHAR